MIRASAGHSSYHLLCLEVDRALADPALVGREAIVRMLTEIGTLLDELEGKDGPGFHSTPNFVQLRLRRIQLLHRLGLFDE
jgi:hypothetical protein